MSLTVYRRATRLVDSAEDVYDWHARPGAIERLSPPWEPVRVLERTGGIADGDRAVLRIGVGPLAVRWVAEHRENEPGRQFCDVQVEGPFARWKHRHRFEPIPDGGCVLEDRIEYALPLEPVSDLVAGGPVGRRIARAFAYRHRRTARDLELHRRYPLGGSRRFAVSGASGGIGSALCALLSTGGHRPAALVRSETSRVPPAAAGTVEWDPAAGRVDAAGLEGTDVVVHLAGEPIAAGRWTDATRHAIRDSRVEGTGLLARTLAGLDRPPRVLICASAIGLYGDRGDEVLDEGSPPGEGFLADVCREWEEAADPARAAGIRVVHIRFGLVLWPGFGALQRMLVPFRAGVGGRLGSGRQFWSWVSLDDVLGAILHCAARDDVEGPVNVTAPRPVRNAAFSRTLARVLGRPACVPAPAAVLRLALGEMADALLLAGARVDPARLRQGGYEFLDPELEPALRHLLGREEGDE
ncbi:MAG: TIGR01777 family oxidoreductase [Gemmatimonadota bacterium]|nr:TIGR01777 family oxidoreductase [Gemmatimonadota bacterium]